MKTVRFWLPGGNSKIIPFTAALVFAPKILRIDDYLWEERVPGVHCEATWEDPENSYAHKTLQDAALSAFPDHAEYGLTLEQAAIICMDKGLVVSTGAAKPYWPDN